MTEKSNLLERLHDLQDLSKIKKKELAKPEREEVLSVLSELCTMDEDGYRVTVEALTDFPSDVGAALLAKNWAHLMDAKLLVTRDLCNAKFNTDLGKRLRIALAQRLLNVDPEGALCLLIDTFQEMKPAKSPIPTSKDLAIIRHALIEPAGKSLARLPLETAMASELRLLTTYVLAATFLYKKSQKPFSKQTQLAIIRWANGFLKPGQLPQDVLTAIAKAVETWGSDFCGIPAQEMDALKAVIHEVLAPVCQTEVIEVSPPPASQNSVPPATPVATVQLQPPTPPQQYDALYEIERIGTYVQRLEIQVKQNLQTIQTAEFNLQQTRNELGEARRESAENLRKLSTERNSFKKLSETKNTLQKEIESLCAQNDKLNQELDAVRNDYKEKEAAHGEQLDTLSERIAREGEHRVDAFRNTVGKIVQHYADTLNEAYDMEMTIELGTALRNQMAQLLRLLKAEGVRINGGL